MICCKRESNRDNFILDLYERITSIRDAKVLLALGGWTDSAGDKYSRLVSDGSARRKFVVGVVSFLRKHGFQGLHVDWNYPVCWQSNCKKGSASDKPNFTKLIQVGFASYLLFMFLLNCLGIVVGTQTRI